MNTDDFEQRMQRQPPRQVPPEWREEILQAANSAPRPSPAVSRPGLLSTLTHQLSTFLWPSPKAWGALAAVWLLLLAMNFSLRDQPEAVAKNTVSPSPEVIVALQNQRRLLAELIGHSFPPDAEPPKHFSPRPRSERCDQQETV